MLALGEVHTSALMHSAPVSPDLAERLLSMVRGERVRAVERPVAYAVSQDTYTGVDCRIPSSSGPQVRGVGTLSARLTLTGGRVVQGSVVTRIESSEASRRQPWSHYLSRLGTVQTIGKVDTSGLAAAHLAAPQSKSTMGMGAVCGRLVAGVQQSTSLDRRSPFVAGRTVLRWVAEAGSGENTVRFTLADDELRTLRLTLDDDGLSDWVDLCEDVALHDWLLSVLLSMLERGRIGSADPVDVIAGLRPAVDHLMHLWMPATRLSEPAREVWQALDHRLGFSRQWDASVWRVRDQISVSAILMNVRNRNSHE